MPAGTTGGALGMVILAPGLGSPGAMPLLVLLPDLPLLAVIKYTPAPTPTAAMTHIQPFTLHPPGQAEAREATADYIFVHEATAKAKRWGGGGSRVIRRGLGGRGGGGLLVMLLQH